VHREKVRRVKGQSLKIMAQMKGGGGILTSILEIFWLGTEALSREVSLSGKKKGHEEPILAPTTERKREQDRDIHTPQAAFIREIPGPAQGNVAQARGRSGTQGIDYHKL